MYISSFQITNYKSFFAPAPLVFTSGFNIVSGQNNAGKTALLEGLGLQFKWNPHKSLKSMPARDTAPGQTSWVDVSFRLAPSELKEIMRSVPGGEYHLPKPHPHGPFANEIQFIDDSTESANRLVKSIFSQETLAFRSRFQAMSNQSSGPVNIEYPTYGLYQPQEASIRVRVNPDGRLETTNTHVGGRDDIGWQLSGIFSKHVYRFTAERLNVGEGPHGSSTILAPNAANLPEVLNQLQHNTYRFQELNSVLRAILPQVQQISVRAIAHGRVEIVVWCHDPKTSREDLAVPLAECGTGIGQVLAILYVVMTSERPQTIIIDEPQSFLHPGAARKLIDFLKLHQQHQFIIATHSPTIIAATNPKTITLATFENGETTLRQLDVGSEQAIQRTLTELGIRLSDVFGADSILWVEGRTEEKCFPLIVEKLLKQPFLGVQILGIRQTGDLEARDAKKVFEIYRSLSSGPSLLPPAIAFVLDDEGRSEQQKRELLHQSENKAVFLKRRMYECYLLNPSAITAVANAVEGFRPVPLATEEVAAALDAKLQNAKYFDGPPKGNRAEKIQSAKAGELLEDLFPELSGTRVAYRKVEHGVALTEWLIQNASQELDEIVELLRSMLKSN